MNIKELSGEVKKCRCENCGRETICYEQGYITPITNTLAYEKWLCLKCIERG